MTVNRSARTLWAPIAAVAMKDSPWQRMVGTALVSRHNIIINFIVSQECCILFLRPLQAYFVFGPPPTCFWQFSDYQHPQ